MSGWLQRGDHLKPLTSRGYPPSCGNAEGQGVLLFSLVTEKGTRDGGRGKAGGWCTVEWGLGV
jgi:hypothetical protein